MGPASRIDPQAALIEYNNRTSCPYSLEPMTEAVSLACGHPLNEPSLLEMGGLPEEPEQKQEGRVTHVKLVNQITCPLCQSSAKEFWRNWSLRETVTTGIPLLKPMEDQQRASNQPKPKRPLFSSLRERFGFTVTTAFGLLGSTFAAYNFSEVKITRGGLFGWGAVQVDTSARDNNMLIAFFSSVVAAASMTAICSYIVLKKMRGNHVE